MAALCLLQALAVKPWLLGEFICERSQVPIPGTTGLAPRGSSVVKVSSLCLGNADENVSGPETPSPSGCTGGLSPSDRYLGSVYTPQILLIRADSKARWVQSSWLNLRSSV